MVDLCRHSRNVGMEASVVLKGVVQFFSLPKLRMQLMYRFSLSLHGLCRWSC